MLNRAGRLELVRSTLASISIFAMMSLDVQIETLLAIEKILRGFCGKAVRKRTVAIVWWRGIEFVCQRSLVDSAFRTFGR
jgi:hypothetical protein